jgi:hypothetical protein
MVLIVLLAVFTVTDLISPTGMPSIVVFLFIPVAARTYFAVFCYSLNA